jgi:hypothetical protein
LFGGTTLLSSRNVGWWPVASPRATWRERRRSNNSLGGWPVALRGAQSRPNGLDHFRPRWQYAQSGPGPTVNDCLAVDKYLELPVRSTNQLDLGIEFAPQSRRHTDGVQSGHSIRAGANLNSGHPTLRSGSGSVAGHRTPPAPACPPNTALSREGRGEARGPMPSRTSSASTHCWTAPSRLLWCRSRQWLRRVESEEPLDLSPGGPAIHPPNVPEKARERAHVALIAGVESIRQTCVLRGLRSAVLWITSAGGWAS